MENFARWQLLLRDVSSPQSFIDFGFYFMIAAALQRRVWIGSDNPNIDGQIYPNPYVILVGKPGLGKTRVITFVKGILQHWRQDLGSGKIVDPTDEATNEHYLFACGPKSITYEQLVDKMSKSYRRVSWNNCNNPLRAPDNSGKPELLPAIYGHSSMYFALGELSALFQKDTKKTTDFLLDIYDNETYDRETKTQGISFMKKPCLSFLAGTTPSFIEDSFSERLLSDGMSSRCWFVYEFAGKQNTWGIKPLDNDQLRARYELILWMKELALVYGRAQLSDEANDYLRDWWENKHPTERPNNNLKLDAYYERKKLHVLKLCMVLHFSETVSTYTIPVEVAIRALKILEGIEARMHYALCFGSRNPLYSISRNILDYMVKVRKPLTKSELLEEFNSEVRAAELDEVVKFMLDTNKVIWKDGKYFPRCLMNSAPQINGHTLVSNKIIGGDLPAIPLSTPITEGEKGEFDEP